MSLPEPKKEVNVASSKYYIGRIQQDGGKCIGTVRMRQRVGSHHSSIIRNSKSLKVLLEY